MIRNDDKMAIVGGGLCGSLLALRLGQRGYDVDVFEMRDDPRGHQEEGGRSINLALSDRGLMALASAGLEAEVRRLCIPMHGRCIHGVDGSTRLSRYSGRDGDYINSVSRSQLNRLMLEKADQHQRVSLFFNHSCTGVDWDEMVINFDGGRSAQYDLCFGTDGAGSRVRRSMMPLLAGASEASEQTDWLTHGYKELEIPPAKTGGWQLDKHALHIWPRDAFMLIALPNLDGSFTVTLFLALKGEHSFERIDEPHELVAFFNQYFPDALELMPELVDDYANNPVGRLGTLYCSPWNYHDKAVLMGDAAHAVVPFYGQGMNASFEDVYVFNQMMDQDWTSREALFSAFYKRRKPNADAIARLAIDNYIEMRDRVNDEAFIEKRRIEMLLESTYDDYDAKYSLVTFREDVPYHTAMHRGQRQDQVLLDLCRSGKTTSMSIDQIKAHMDTHV